MADPNAPPPAPPRVSALIVSYNRQALLRRALEAVERSEDRANVEVVVLDNGSTDGSPQLETEFTQMRFVRIPKNFGLTKALNLGIRGSTGEYVLFLHDDTQVFPDALKLLVQALDQHADAGAVCPLLVGEGGLPSPQLGEFPPHDTWNAAKPGTEPLAVDYCRGAALMMRRSLLTAIRQIDERYGQFGGDADLCYQIRRAGKRILLIPNARARHSGHETESPLRAADRRLGTVAWIGKYQGFVSGLVARLAAIFGTLGAGQFSVLKYLLGSQKIDGSQLE